MIHTFPSSNAPNSFPLISKSGPKSPGAYATGQLNVPITGPSKQSNIYSKQRNWKAQLQTGKNQLSVHTRCRTGIYHPILTHTTGPRQPFHRGQCKGRLTAGWHRRDNRVEQGVPAIHESYFHPHEFLFMMSDPDNVTLFVKVGPAFVIIKRKRGKVRVESFIWGPWRAWERHTE